MKLHLGCGTNYISGWVNIDVTGKIDRRLDLRKPLPFPDKSVDFIFTEAFIEHLSREEGQALFKECRRVLKPSGVLRISTPDARFVVEKYLEKNLTEWENINYLPSSSCRMLNETFTAWGHRFVYDKEELFLALAAEGFSVGEVEWQKSEHPELRNLECRLPHSEIRIEASLAPSKPTYSYDLQKAKEMGSQCLESELTALFQAVLSTPAGAVIEIGSASGGTTFVLSEAAEIVGKTVYSVDTYPEELEGTASHYEKGLMKKLKRAFKRNVGSRPNVIQINKTTADCISELPEASVIFIDGLHELTQIKEEFSLLLPALVPGGKIFIHDINWQAGQLSGTPEEAACHAIKLFDGFEKRGTVGYMAWGEK